MLSYTFGLIQLSITYSPKPSTCVALCIRISCYRGTQPISSQFNRHGKKGLHKNSIFIFVFNGMKIFDSDTVQSSGFFMMMNFNAVSADCLIEVVHELLKQVVQKDHWLATKKGKLFEEMEEWTGTKLGGERV